MRPPLAFSLGVIAAALIGAACLRALALLGSELQRIEAKLQAGEALTSYEASVVTLLLRGLIPESPGPLDGTPLTRE